MFPNVVRAYKKQGFDVRLGNTSHWPSGVFPENRREALRTGAGISVADAFVFAVLARHYSPAAIFIIGNAAGLSTFTLAELFPAAKIDAIDAETEKQDNVFGSELTRKIAADAYPNVQLTSGFSPQDVPRATRSEKYQLVFIDGLHTDRQMKLDFDGVAPLLDEPCVVVCHDVGTFRMQRGWQEVKQASEALGFRGYPLVFTPFGSCVLVRGLPELDDYFRIVSEDFGNLSFAVGRPPRTPFRPKFWDYSFNQIERGLKRRLKRWFGRG